MKLVNSILPILSVSLALCGADVDPAARKALVSHLNQSSAEFMNSVKGLTPEQWNYKPGANVWSIAECAEHIALSEDFLRQMVENKVLTGAAIPERAADERKMLDEKVLKMITDRSFKATAPEPLRPTQRFATPAEALQKFQESRMKTIALAQSRNDLREHAAPHPVLKELDAYQWVLYLSGHTLRHTAQIREVKADAGFPKGN